MKTSIALFSAILLTSQFLLAQSSSYIELYDSTGAQKTGRLGWKGNATDGHFFIEGQNKEVSVKNGTVTADRFAGDGSGLTNLPSQSTTVSVSDVRGLSDSLRLKSPVSHSHGASQITDTIQPSQVQYGDFMINSAGEDGQVWKADGTGRGYWGDDLTSSGTGTGGAVAWTEITGKPSTFVPSAHPHVKADISDLPTYFKSHWDSISAKPTLYRTAWDSIGNKPAIGTITGVSGTGGLSGSGSAGSVSLSIADGGVTGDHILDGTIHSGDLGDTSVAGTKIKDGAVTGLKIADGTITNSDVSSVAAISYSKLAGTPSSLPPSGSAGGDLTGSYPNPSIADNAVSGVKIQDASITNIDIADNAAISGTKISPDFSTQVITGGKFAFAPTTYDKMTIGYRPGISSGYGAGRMYITNDMTTDTIVEVQSGTPSIVKIRSGVTTNTSLYLAAATDFGYIQTSTGDLVLRPNMGNSGTVNVHGSLSATGSVSATVSCCLSDRRYKKAVLPILNGLERIRKLQGVTYEWDCAAFPDKGFGSERQVGLIAQDIEPIVPEVVRTDDKGMKSVSYDKLTAVLIEAVKEQQTMIEQLREENAMIRARLGM